MQDNVRIPPPTLGEHNEEILISLAYSREQIEKLKNEGVV
jgi:crotonobetainyl-CoA:carnitine CoA-transferase CaiB-like acyl-CoA transferase